MARQHEIEARVVDIARRVERGAHVEDARVELKARWPEHDAKFARQLAAACNAAHGDEVVWIIGLDEKNGVIGTQPKDLSDYWPTVAANFDQLAPSLIRDVLVPIGEKVVVVLVFSSSRAPYVVKNPQRNQPGAGPVELEVPWREGTKTRSARREDLIRMLVPIAKAPEIEFVNGTVAPALAPIDPVTKLHLAHFEMRIYVTPRGEQQLVLPYHRRATSICFSDDPTATELDSLRVTTDDDIERAMFAGLRSQQMPPDHRGMIRHTARETVVIGPGMIVCVGTLKRLRVCPIGRHLQLPLDVRLDWKSTDADVSLRLEGRFMFESPSIWTGLNGIE